MTVLPAPLWGIESGSVGCGCEVVLRATQAGKAMRVGDRDYDGHVYCGELGN
jgi:hypothetical protein